MRLIVFFDLPTKTNEDLKEYRNFRKELIKMGFMMMQESVYIKLALNASVEKLITAKVNKIKPKKGLVQLLIVTEKQFSNMQTILGKENSGTLDTDERIVLL